MEESRDDTELSSIVRPQSCFRDATHIGVQIDSSIQTCPLASVISVTDEKPTVRHITRERDTGSEPDVIHINLMIEGD